MTRRLQNATTLVGIGDLIEVKLKNVGLGKTPLQGEGFKGFHPARPECAGAGMQNTHALLGNGAGAAHNFARLDILRHGMKARQPIDAVMTEKTFVFGQHESLLQQQWNVV